MKRKAAHRFGTSTGGPWIRITSSPPPTSAPCRKTWRPPRWLARPFRRRCLLRLAYYISKTNRLQMSTLCLHACYRDSASVFVCTSSRPMLFACLTLRMSLRPLIVCETRTTTLTGAHGGPVFAATAQSFVVVLQEVDGKAHGLALVAPGQGARCDKRAFAPSLPSFFLPQSLLLQFFVFNFGCACARALCTRACSKTSSSSTRQVRAMVDFLTTFKDNQASGPGLSWTLDSYSWFVVVDDDTYVKVPQFLTALEGRGDPSHPTAVGRKFFQTSMGSLLGGGPGIAMSRGAVEAIRDARCTTTELPILGHTVPGGDGWLGQCMNLAKVRMDVVNVKEGR